MSKLGEKQSAAVMASVLEITGAKNLLELEERAVQVTKEQWREAYDIAGVGWEDYEDSKLH